MTINKDYTCPACGTSDFKVESGFYVCQICGHQTMIENTSSAKKRESRQRKEKPNKSANTSVALIIFAFLASLALLSLFLDYRVSYYRRGDYYIKYFYIRGTRLIYFLFDLFRLLTLIGFVCVSALKKSFSEAKSVYITLFITYAIFLIAPTFFTMIRFRLQFSNLLYNAIYFTFVWFTTFKFTKK